jgi:protein-S-isoprenylcysteine O-methyltransferase Ste14
MALARKRGSGRPAHRDPRGLVGLAVQALGVSLCFAVQRLIGRAPVGLEAILGWLGVALAWASAWLTIRSVRVLGREWSLEARLVQGHRLVTQGPYRHVRHPIYAGLLGLLVGTGLNVTAWPALVAGVALYLVGTRLRIRVEEGLLLQQFGEEYARYAAQVPALLPRPFTSRPSQRP